MQIASLIASLVLGHLRWCGTRYTAKFGCLPDAPSKILAVADMAEPLPKQVRHGHFNRGHGRFNHLDYVGPTRITVQIKP